jgi:mannosyltransferase OCH1-like enzyme
VEWVANSVAGGANSLAAFAACRYGQVASTNDQMELVRQFTEASAMASTGPTLLAAVTAAYLTPIQTAVQNFTTTYQSGLKLYKLI